MSTHQSLPKTANAKKKSDILPIPAQSKSHPVIAQPKIESTRSNEAQLAQMRAQREASERLGSTLLTPESVPRTLPPLQPKLTIGQPGDQYEQEADRVARQVVDHINAPPKIQAKETHQPMSVGERKPSKLDHLPAQRVQRQATGGEMDASPDLESSIQRARGGGQPLDNGIRARMEGAFGADFSGVRVHTDGTSDQLNQSIQAKAFTTGQDVFFRKGAYNPGSRGGQELLAHELTHVVQQSGGIDKKERKSVIQRVLTYDAHEQIGQHPVIPIIRTYCPQDVKNFKNLVERGIERHRWNELHQVYTWLSTEPDYKQDNGTYQYDRTLLVKHMGELEDIIQEAIDTQKKIDEAQQYIEKWQGYARWIKSISTTIGTSSLITGVILEGITGTFFRSSITSVNIPTLNITGVRMQMGGRNLSYTGEMSPILAHENETETGRFRMEGQVINTDSGSTMPLNVTVTPGDISPEEWVPIAEFGAKVLYIGGFGIAHLGVYVANHLFEPSTKKEEKEQLEEKLKIIKQEALICIKK